MCQDRRVSLNARPGSHTVERAWLRASGEALEAPADRGVRRGSSSALERLVLASPPMILTLLILAPVAWLHLRTNEQSPGTAIASLLVSLLAACGDSAFVMPAGGTFAATGSLATPRVLHSATLLPNGKVLIAAGMGTLSPTPLASGEVYDPAAGTFSATGNLVAGRAGHTATLLPNGKVLMAAGTGEGPVLASAELYDPASGTFAATGSLSEARTRHTATLLPDGKVLVVGGSRPTGNGSTEPLASAELFDPSTGTFTATASLATARSDHSATLLPDGRVLIVGGETGDGGILDAAELYDPAIGSFIVTGRLNGARTYHTATLLLNGKVLVAGGYGSTARDTASSELYDVATGSFTPTGRLQNPRNRHTATLLAGGQVLVAGGGTMSGGASLGSSELYDPVAGRYASTGDLLQGRAMHTATLLLAGKVLIAAGNPSLATAELFDPAGSVHDASPGGP